MKRLLVPAAAVALLALAGCTTPGPITTPSSTSDAVTVKNCGTDVTFASAPKRVVTIKSTSTEMLLALGLGDRIVGTAFQDGPVPEQWADAAKDVPEISEFMPGEEAVLDLEPDLVYSGWESAFASDAAGERNELSSLGVASYVQPAACRSAQVPGKLDFDEIFREIGEVASIFRVDDSDLIAQQKQDLAAITPDDRGLTALWYSSGTDTPYVGAGLGAPELVMETAGFTNIFGDLDQTWSSVSWESIIDADPDIIILVDADWNTAQSKMDMLEDNPATRNLTAVKKNHYIVVPFASSEAGVRTVSAVQDVMLQLKNFTEL